MKPEAKPPVPVQKELADSMSVMSVEEKWEETRSPVVDHDKFMPKEAHDTAFHRSVECFIEGTHKFEDRVRAPIIVTDLISMLEKSHDVYEVWATDQTSICIGSKLLKEIKGFLDKIGVTEELGGNSSPESIMNNEKTDEFYRLFSVLNFLLCMEKTKREENHSEGEAAGGDEYDAARAGISDAQLFGHGFAITGSVLLHIFGQRTKFKIFDFAKHVVNVNEIEVYTESGHSSGMKLDDPMRGQAAKFIQEAEAQHLVQELMFGILSKSCEGKEDCSNLEPATPHTYKPPDSDMGLEKLPSNGRMMLRRSFS